MYQSRSSRSHQLGRVVARRTLALIVALWAGGVTACASAPAGQGSASASMSSSDRAALHAEIVALNRQMEAAFARGDMKAVAAFYADDGKLHGPRKQIVVGRAGIDAYWARVEGAKSWKLDVFETGGSRSDAYQVGRSTLVTSGSSGDRTSISDFVVLWKRGPDGVLRIALDFYHF